MEADKHVFVEKPLAETADQCRELLDMARDRRLKLQCGYIERFNPIIKKIRDDNPDPKFLTFIRENKFAPHITNDITIDTAVHDIDLAMWFFGCKPTRIQGEMRQDYCSLILTFPTGVASVNCSWLYGGKIRSINNISTITSEDILRHELNDFLLRDKVLAWNALHVQEVIENVMERQAPINS